VEHVSEKAHFLDLIEHLSLNLLYIRRWGEDPSGNLFADY
jgi:hypothetical protein